MVGIDLSGIHNDPRVVAAADGLPNGKVDRRVQLLTSGYDRHADAYRAFGEKTEGRPGMKCLIIGLGNLSETMGYVATYYNDHGTTEGLDITMVDYVDKSFFTDLAAKPETYCLGRDDQGRAVVPMVGQEKAFVYNEEMGGYVLGVQLAEFIAKVVDQGHYGMKVQQLGDLNLPDGCFDFVSCQNVLTYVPDILGISDGVVANLVAKTATDGVLAVRTDGKNTAIATCMERRGLPVAFLTEEKERNGLYKKIDYTDENRPVGFVAREEQEKKRQTDNMRKTGNVFGI